MKLAREVFTRSVYTMKLARRASSSSWLVKLARQASFIV